MRKVVSRFGLTLLTVAFLVGAAEKASAVAVNLFHSPANNGTFTTDPFDVTALPTMTLNLWATPSIDTYALSPLTLTTTGGLTMGACTAATGVLCGATTATTRLMGWADDINGSLAGVPIRIGTIVVTNTGGAGTLNLTAGMGVDFAFGDYTIDPNTILFSTAVIPEPGTLLLLGTGLTGLVIQGRRRQS